MAGAPGRSRTCDPRFRKPVLYPAELRAHVIVFWGSRASIRAPLRPRHCIARSLYDATGSPLTIRLLKEPAT
jgi:hypothetical protein